MGYRAALLNFSKGVISPELESRFDLQTYQAALRQATNVKIRRTGGVSKRMGTRFVAESIGENGRLIPFQFSDTQAYALEFAQAVFRPYALGGAVLELGLAVTAITKAVNAQVTSAYHGYEAGDQVYFVDIPGMVEINDRFLTVVSVIDEHNFTVDFDSRDATDFDGPDTGTVRTSAPSAPAPAPTVPPVITPAPPPVVSVGGSGGYGGPGAWQGRTVNGDLN